VSLKKLFFFLNFADVDSALTLWVGQQEGHPSCKSVGCWYVGGDSLTGALHVL